MRRVRRCCLTKYACQWSGYEEFSRQIQLKDQTRSRNPITLGRWAQYVATTVSRFLEVC